MDDLRTLWAFTAVARAGSFTAAADQLGISTVALSRSVARLEESLNTRLFVRTTRLVVLTDAGRELFDRVNQPFAAIGEALTDVRRSSGRLTGTVRVSSVTSYGRRRVIPVLRQFFDHYPGITVALTLHDVAPGRSRQGHDIRINWGEPPEQDKVAHFLATLPLAVVASPDYLQRRGTPGHPAELAGHACITAAFDGGSRGRWLFRRRGAPGDSPDYVHDPLGPVVVLGELEAVADAAVAGLGIAVVSADDTADLRAEGRLRVILADYEVIARGRDYSRITLQHPLRKLMAPATRVLVDFLLDRLTEGAPESGDGTDGHCGKG